MGVAQQRWTDCQSVWCSMQARRECPPELYPLVRTMQMCDTHQGWIEFQKLNIEHFNLDEETHCVRKATCLIMNTAYLEWNNMFKPVDDLQSFMSNDAKHEWLNNNKWMLTHEINGVDFENFIEFLGKKELKELVEGHADWEKKKS